MTKHNKMGYVYIFTNKSFREDWVKIGKTKDVDHRLTQLDNTSCPLPFDVYATLKTTRYDEAEAFVHDFISHFNNSLRIRPNREYFKVSPEEALEILYKVKRLMNEPDAEITVYDVNGEKCVKQIEKKHAKHENNKKATRQQQEQIQEKKDDTVQPVPVKNKVQANQMVWLLPSNPKYFNLKQCYKDKGQVYWRIKSNFQKVKQGDRGYIYSSRPDKAILYSFEVVEANIPYTPKMDLEDKYSAYENNKYWGDTGGLFALLKMSEIANKKNLTLEHLKKNGLNGAPQNAVILSQKKFEKLLSFIENNKTLATPVKTAKKKEIKPNFRFSMIGLKQGDVITFIPTNTKVTIADDDKSIIYKGEKYTLTGFCKKYMPDEKRIPSNAYQGPLYFSYNNKTLTKIRAEKEKNI